MSARGRVSWLIRWGGLALCVAILVVWGLSQWWGLGWWSGTGGVVAESGAVAVQWGFSPGTASGLVVRKTTPKLWGFFFFFRSEGTCGVCLPLWTLLVAVAAVSAPVWWFRRRRLRAKATGPSCPSCSSCGYSIAGLGAGAPCPECGSDLAPCAACAKARTPAARVRESPGVRRRRFVLRAGACLLMGVAATVVVAWECALRAQRLVEREPTLSAGPPGWLVPVPDEWRAAAAEPPPRQEHVGTGWRERMVIAELPPAEGRAGRRFGEVWLLRAGLPVPALQRGRMTERVAGAGRVSSADLTPSVWRGWRPGWLTEGTLPLVPVWPGFALDTVAYGAAAFLMWSCPTVLRPGLRRSRTLYRACRRSFRGTGGATCPECGRARA